MKDNEYLTHESMLEIAEQREALNTKKLEIQKQFDEWFGELEGYSFRSERFWDDYDYAKESGDTSIIKKWLMFIFEQGYHACESKKDT
jgi:hypothetical protein